MNKKKDIIMWCDAMVIIGIVMFILMRVAVVFVFNMTAAETGADIEAVHTTYEANPVFKAIMRMKMLGYMLNFIIIPALMITIYIIYRGKLVEGKITPDVLQFYTTFTFFLILFNFVNDVAALAGRVL
jgi:hypothetical protein